MKRIRMKHLAVPALVLGLLLPGLNAHAGGGDYKKKDESATKVLGEEQQRTMEEARTAKEEPKEDQKSAAAKILSAVHFDNQVEIRAGQIAKDKGSTGMVQEFGAQLVKEHSASDKQAKSVAKKLGVELKSIDLSKIENVDEASLEPEQRKALQMIQKLEETSEGLEFDRVFAQQMQTAHKDSINSMLKKISAEKIEDPAMIELVQSFLPMLHEHHSVAKDIDMDLGVASK